MAMTVGPGGNPYGVGGTRGSGRTGGLQGKFNDPGKTTVEPSVIRSTFRDGHVVISNIDDGDPTYYERVQDKNGKWVITKTVKLGDTDFDV